jgi:MoxR-like ATPase
MDKDSTLSIQDKLRIVLNNPHGTNPAVPAIMLEGEPGAGKTYGAEEFARKYGYSKLFFQCTDGTSEEQFIYGINAPKLADAISVRGISTGEDALVKGILWEAIALSHRQTVVLIIDEYDKSQPSTDAVFLDFLNSGRISHPMFQGYNHLSYVQGTTLIGNPKNIKCIFTSNGERKFIDPLYRRITTIKVQFPQPEEMVDILSANIEKEYITTDAVKLMSSFLYNWRTTQSNKSYGIQKTLVQNEVIRIMSILVEEYQQGNTDIDYLTEVAGMLISPHKEDIERYNFRGGSPLKYWVSQFIAKCNIVKTPKSD